MHWKMREEYKIAYNKAAEVLENINYKENYKENGMIRTASVIDAVEELTGIDVKFAEYDFSKLTDKKKKVNVEHYGAAMCVSENDNAKTATIFLNNKATAKMQRFSLIHELGHLITDVNTVSIGKYKISAHIDMDITTIPEKILNDKKYAFLIDEQIANIFALLVLIPYDLLCEEAPKYNKFEDLADAFGVETNAIISRMILEKGAG